MTVICMCKEQFLLIPDTHTWSSEVILNNAELRKSHLKVL